MRTDYIIDSRNKQSELYNIMPKTSSKDIISQKAKQDDELYLQSLGSQLTISDEALELFNKQITEKYKDENQQENKIRDYYLELRDQLKQAHESADATGESFETLGKCIQIAMRIVSGDKVPIQDERYLMENNMELYSMAMNMRMIKEDPKEWDSLLEEEKETLKLQEFSLEEHSIDTGTSIDSSVEAINNEGL